MERTETPDTHRLAPAAPADEIDLRQYYQLVLKHRRIIALCTGVAIVLAIVVSLLSTPTYQATVVLNVEKEKGSPFDIGAQQPGYSAYDPEFLPTQTRLMRSREVAERVVQRLNLLENSAFSGKKSALFANDKKKPVIAAAQALQRRIDVRPLRGTNLVELSYEATSPQLAADIANALADSYIDWTLEAKYQIVGQASKFLTAQIAQLKSEVDQREQQLQAYGRQKDILSTEPGSNVTMQKLESLNKEYADAVADRVSKEARYHSVQTARADTIADTLSNGLITQLRNDQARLEREYAEKLNLYKPEWPAMQQLKAQIEKGRQNLNSTIQETVAKARDIARADYETALRREQSLAGVMTGQKNEAMQLNSNSIEYNNLRVEVETKRTLLDTLSKREAETQVQSRLRDEKVSNIRVVDRAIPPVSRFRPSYKKNLALAIFLGGALGLAIAFGLEYLDRSLRSTNQVETFLHLPALGIIPSTLTPVSKPYYGLRRKSVKATRSDVPIELLPDRQPHSTIAEAYRAVRAALLLSQAGGVQSIVVTSSLMQEGKSSTSANLATVLGQLGKRVVVVDGDLHKPRLHEIFRISNRIGLVSVLAENAKPSEAIVNTSVKNVFALPAGPSAPNPSALISSDLMRNLFAFLKSNFDYVIVDSPPVAAVADALLLGQLVDGVVLCVKGGRTPREVVARVRDHLRRSNVRILGVLVNNLEESSAAYGEYYRYSNAYYAYSDREKVVEAK